MRSENYTCDIKDCGEPATHKQKAIQVIFLSDQTEGRSCAPYLSDQKIDLCEKHMTKLLEKEKYITATGAQGYNTYYL